MKSMENCKETELGPIPLDWELESLENNADFKNGINFTREEKGDVGFLTIDVLNMYTNDISVNLSNLYRVNKKIDENYFLKDGDILFVRSSLKREGVGWASMFEETKEKATYCGFIIRARLKTDSINPKFLTYYARTNMARNALVSSSGKVAITNINQGMLGKLLVPIPPLSEQRNIAFILSSVQQAIEKAQAVTQATQEFKKSLMNHLFTYGPVPISEREQVQLKETEIGEMPEEWKVVKIGNIVKIQGGYAFKSEDYVVSGVKILKIGNVSFGKTNWDDISFLPEKYIQKYDDYVLKENDLVMPMTRPVVRGGIKGSRIKSKDMPCLLNQRVCRFIALKNKEDLDYLYHIIFNKSFIELISGGALGSQQPNISASKIENIKIPLPDLTNRRKISQILSVIDMKIEVEKYKKQLLEKLFKSLLDSLMTGKLRTNEAKFNGLEIAS